MASRKGFRRRKRRIGADADRGDDATRRTRDEARRIAAAERSAARAARREGLVVRVRGVILEARRRARPAHRGLARVAPYVSAFLLLVVRIPAALVATLLDLAQDTSAWLRSRIGPALAGVTDRLSKAVTPVRTLVVVSAAAAFALGASQFTDFAGVSVGGSGYSGDVKAIAPPPQTALETAGSAHLYLLVPAAALALVLIVATARGRWRLGRAVALVGAVAIAVALLVDLPQGLDKGEAGTAYVGTEAELIEGFWAQTAAGAALVLCGPLLGLYARRAAGDGARESRRRARRSRRRSRPQRLETSGRAATVQARART